MSMAIKGLYSSDWLYTQTPLPWISFLQPWHCWHHSFSLSISSERERGQAQRGKKKWRCETAMEYQGRQEKRNVWHFQPPGVFVFRSFGYNFRGYCADAQTPKEAIWDHSSCESHHEGHFLCFFAFLLNTTLQVFCKFFAFLCAVCDSITSVLLLDSRWCRWSYLVAHYPPYTYEILTAPLFHCSYAALLLLSIWTKSASTVWIVCYTPSYLTGTDMHYSEWHFNY